MHHYDEQIHQHPNDQMLLYHILSVQNHRYKFIQDMDRINATTAVWTDGNETDNVTMSIEDSSHLATANYTGNMTLSSNATIIQDETTIPVDYVYTLLFTYVAPIIIILGTIGNVLTLVVLQSRYYRNSPSTFILSALALTDTGVLLCGLMRHWINNITNYELDIRTLTRGTCWIHIYFTYLLPQLSSWSLALLTVERMASVMWPFKAKQLFSKRRMAAAWFGVLIGLGVLNSHWFVTVDLIYYVDKFGIIENGYLTCDNVSEGVNLRFLNEIWPWLDLVVFSVIPIIIIIGCNVIIITKLLQARKIRQDTMKVTTDDDSSSITTMLVGISVTFILTTVPIALYFIGEYGWPYETADDRYNTLTAYAVTNLFYYLSNSTNFLIYCISGSRFRRALVAVLCCRDMERGPMSSTASTAASRYRMSTVNKSQSENQPTTQDNGDTGVNPGADQPVA